MKKLILVLSALVFTFTASAQVQPLKPFTPYGTPKSTILMPTTKHTYDWQTGNSYTTNTDALGNTTINGYNTQTGSMWNTKIDKQGNMNGTDAKGNMWNYNKNSKTYHNYGTGKTCYGEGASKVCY